MKYSNEDSQLELDLGIEPEDAELVALLAHLRAIREQKALKAVGENGGLVIGFDPMAFCAALQSVRMPGESNRPAETGQPADPTRKTPPPPLVEVVITPGSLRMRSQSAYITFETEFPLKPPLEDFPAEGLAFKIDPRRLDPFFKSTIRSTNKNGETRISRKWQPMGFDALEYVPSESMIVLSRKDGRFGLSVVPTAPSDPLQSIDEGAGIPLRSIGSIANSLTAASFVRTPDRARARPVAVFKDGEFSAVSNSCGVCIVSDDLGGLDFSLNLDTPIKLATVLRRLGHPARLKINDGQVLVDDGRYRCAFSVGPKTAPPLTSAGQMSEVERSRWEIPNDDLLRLAMLFHVVSADEPDKEMDLSVPIRATGPILRAKMVGRRASGTGYFQIRPVGSAFTSDAPAFGEARVRVAEFAKAVGQLRGKRQLIAINSKAVVLVDERDDMQFIYLVRRTDLSQR